MCEKWRYLLLGNKFTVHTDHKNLEELFNRARNFRAGKLYRWAARLQEFDFDAKYIPGYDNICADYLSRLGCKNIDRDIPYLNESRTARKIATHDIEALYLSHFHSQIINNKLNIDDCNYYFNDIEHELYSADHLLPSYARQFASKNYKSDGIDAAPFDYLNNIVNYKCNINCINIKNTTRCTLT